MNRCAECGRPLGLVGSGWGVWRHTPDEDELLDATDEHGAPLRRRFVCSAVTPRRISDSLPREAEGYCYTRARHQLWAGTNATDWVLVSDRIPTHIRNQREREATL